MSRNYKIDATIANDSANDRRVYETQKKYYQQEAKREWVSSTEAKSLDKTLMVLIKIFGACVLLCFIIVLIIDPGIEAETFGLPLLWTGTFYGFPATIIYLIVRSNKKKAFIEYYVSKKLLEHMDKDK